MCVVLCVCSLSVSVVSVSFCCVLATDLLRMAAATPTTATGGRQLSTVAFKYSSFPSFSDSISQCSSLIVSGFLTCSLLSFLLSFLLISLTVGPSHTIALSPSPLVLSLLITCVSQPLQ